MKRFIVLLFFFVFLGAICAAQNSQTPQTRNIEPIALPEGLKWGMSVEEVAKQLKVSKLIFKDPKYSYVEINEKKLWLYFSNDTSKKLFKLFLAFKTMNAFEKYMRDFTTTYRT